MKIPKGSLAELKGVSERENFSYYLEAFSAEVDSSTRIAKMVWREPPEWRKKEEERRLAVFMGLERVLEQEIVRLAKEDYRKSPSDFDRHVASITIFMYLYYKVIEFHKAAVKKNKIGLYSILGTVRDSIYRLLVEDYFRRPFVEVMEDYLRIEPRLVACAQLTGTDLVAIHDAVPLYQDELLKRIRGLVKEKPAKKPTTPKAKKTTKKSKTRKKKVKKSKKPKKKHRK